MPRGRPKKFKNTSDLIKTVSEIAQRDLTATEEKAVIEAARCFIRENFSPTQVFDEEVLKETVISHGIILEEPSDRGDDLGDEDNVDNGSGGLDLRNWGGDDDKEGGVYEQDY